MSDYSPPTRPGYTKTGKSLKAVRRYYAQKNSPKNKRDRSPPEDDDRDEKPYSVSKRKRSPDDDVLSKRIAAELKVTQEANEKRKDRDQVANQPTERSALPIMIKPRENGPTFVTEPINNAVEVKQDNKSIKSVQLPASLPPAPTPAAPLTQDSPRDQEVQDMDSSAIGCFIACGMIGAAYITIWIILMTEIPTKIDKLKMEGFVRRYDNLMRKVRWLSFNSFIILPTVTYFLILRNRFRHTFMSLIVMSLCALSITVCFVYTFIIKKELPLTPPSPQSKDAIDPLELFLSVVYLILHFLVVGILIKHVLYLLSLQMDSKYDNKSGPNVKDQTHMSLYLSPI